MATLSAMRAANRAFSQKSEKGLVGVFVGATSGLGENTMKSFTKYTNSPRIYFVGRNREAGMRLTKELKTLNPSSTVTFIQTDDLALLKNAVKVADEIKANESRINVLVLSQGYFTHQGRNETPEGLDRKLSLHYYTRQLLATTFLPLLHSASTTTNFGSRVLSILGTGNEGPITSGDFGLTTHYSLGAAANHAVSGTTLVFQHLSTQYPEIGWNHVNPGWVRTNIGRDLPWWLKVPLKGLEAGFGWLSVPKEESEEGLGWIAMDQRWGKGLNLIDWRGRNKDVRAKSWNSKGLEEEVWEHTQKVFEEVLGERTG